MIQLGTNLEPQYVPFTATYKQRRYKKQQAPKYNKNSLKHTHPARMVIDTYTHIHIEKKTETEKPQIRKR